MACDDVEILRRAFATWNASELDRLVEMLGPAFEFIPLRSQLDGATYRGPDGMRQFAADVAEEWEYLRIVSEEFRVVGEEILMLGRFEARGCESGMDIQFPCGWVARVSDGKLVYLRTYSDPQEALAAVGLSEPA